MIFQAGEDLSALVLGQSDKGIVGPGLTLTIRTHPVIYLVAVCRGPDCHPGTSRATSSTWEELLASHNGNDHLFAFVCSANTKTTKLRTSSFTLPSTDPETAPEIKYPANAWDLIPDINGKAEVQSAPVSVGKPDSGRFTRSKSCQIIRESETDGLNENKLAWKDKNLIGSRSFHTVEEYDALLERIRNFSIESFEDYCPWEDVKSEQTNDLDENQNDRCIQRTNKDSPRKGPGIKDGFVEEFVQTDGTREMGWRRKAVAKGLKTLDVSTVEFPAIARFKQRIHVEGQIYSPGTYITPKFGSYNARVTPETQGKDGGENSVFSPELLAAFEDCVQQLQDEEDNILRNMDGDSPIDDGNGESSWSSIKHEN
ncbi:hypothetical protein DH2020_017113 [Rehmannia glutinosa]|uniref:Uncharacterized protein n=1 Tax=Rehmannia glutinosa TaxID=99300 RepID=A0ABR0WPX7_REHGL